MSSGFDQSAEELFDFQAICDHLTVEQIRLEQLHNCAYALNELDGKLEHCTIHPVTSAYVYTAATGAQLESIQFNISTKELAENLFSLWQTILKTFENIVYTIRNFFKKIFDHLIKLSDNVRKLIEKTQQLKRQEAIAQSSTFALSYADQLFFENEYRFESIEKGLDVYKKDFQKLYKEIFELALRFYNEIGEQVRTENPDEILTEQMRNRFKDELSDKLGKYLPMSLPGGYEVNLRRIDNPNVSFFHMPQIVRRDTQQTRTKNKPAIEVELPSLDDILRVLKKLDESIITMIEHRSKIDDLTAVQDGIRKEADRLHRQLKRQDSVSSEDKRRIAKLFQSLTKDHTAIIQMLNRRAYTHHRSLTFTIQSALKAYA